MAVIKVSDLAYGRLRSPDLDVQEAFLTAFGMVRTARTPTALYMRGTDPVHHIHVTEKGDPGFVGFAWAARDEDDLKAIAKFPGASGIENILAPGTWQYWDGHRWQASASKARERPTASA